MIWTPALSRRRRRSGGGVRIVASDTFNRANNALTLGTLDTGQTWVVDSGAGTVAGINSNQAYLATVDASATNNIAAECGVANCSVSIKMMANINGDIRLRFRCQDKDNEIFTSSISGKLQLYKRVAGAQSQVGSDAIHTWAVGDKVTVVGSGNQVSVYINDVIALAAQTIAELTTVTRHGFGLGGGGDPSSRWDDFLVTAP